MRRLSLLLLLLAAAIAPGAQASPGHPGCGHPGAGHGPDPAGFVAHHAERLGLDAGTLEAIEGIVAASREETEDLRRELREARDRLHELLSASEPDEAQVMEQVEAIGQLETRLHQARVRALLQIRALLTPEQRAELERIREEGPFARFRAAAEACAEDVERLCPEAAGRGPHALLCLKHREDEVSESCRAALEELPHRGHHRHGGHCKHAAKCEGGGACEHAGGCAHGGGCGHAGKCPHGGGCEHAGPCAHGGACEGAKECGHPGGRGGAKSSGHGAGCSGDGA